MPDISEVDTLESNKLQALHLADQIIDGRRGINKQSGVDYTANRGVIAYYINEHLWDGVDDVIILETDMVGGLSGIRIILESYYMQHMEEDCGVERPNEDSIIGESNGYFFFYSP
jgi:hypothetical protein